MALPWMTGGVAGVDEEEQKLPFAIPSRKQVFGEEEEAAPAPPQPAPVQTPSASGPQPLSWMTAPVAAYEEPAARAAEPVEQAAAPEPPADDSFLGDLKLGAKATIGGLYQAATDTLPQTVGGAIRGTDVPLRDTGVIDRMIADQQRDIESKQLSPEEKERRLFGIINAGDVESGAQSVGYSAATKIPQFVAQKGGAVVGGALGTLLSPGVGTAAGIVGGLAAGAGAGYAVASRADMNQVLRQKRDQLLELNPNMTEQEWEGVKQEVNDAVKMHGRAEGGWEAAGNALQLAILGLGSKWGVGRPIIAKIAGIATGAVGDIPIELATEAKTQQAQAAAEREMGLREPGKPLTFGEALGEVGPQTIVTTLLTMGLGGAVSQTGSAIKQHQFVKNKPGMVSGMAAAGVRPEIIERVNKAHTYSAYEKTVQDNSADIFADAAIAADFQGVSDKQAADLLARMRAKYPEHRQTQVVGSQDPRDTIRAIVEIQRGLAPGALRRPTATMRPTATTTTPTPAAENAPTAQPSPARPAAPTVSQVAYAALRDGAGSQADDALKAAIEDPEGLIAAIQAEIDARIAQEASGDQDAPTPAPIVPDAPTGQPAAQTPPISAPQAPAGNRPPSAPAPMPASPAAPAGQAVRPPPGTPPEDQGAAPSTADRLRQIADEIGYDGPLPRTIADANRIVRRQVERSNELQKTTNKMVRDYEKRGMSSAEAWAEVEKTPEWREFASEKPKVERFQSVFVEDAKPAEAERAAEPPRPAEPVKAEGVDSDGYVLDKKGKRATVLHGSHKATVAFEDGKTAFFTDNDFVAKGYTWTRGIGRRPSAEGSVTKAQLVMKKPLVIDANGKRNDNIPVPWKEWKPKVFGNLPPDAVSVEDAAEYAKQNGYDGVIIRNVIDSADVDDRTKSTVYAVFSPSQIKTGEGEAPRAVDAAKPAPPVARMTKNDLLAELRAAGVADRDLRGKDRAALAKYAESVRAGSEVAPVQASAAKESWQMTRAEYARGAKVRRDMKRNYVIITGPDGKEVITRTLEPGQPEKGLIEGAHRVEISEALAAGKPVPAEVLADYPDLKPKVAEKPKAPPSGLSVPSVESSKEKYADWGIKEQIMALAPQGSRSAGRLSNALKAAGVPHQFGPPRTLGSKRSSVKIPNTQEAINIVRRMGGTIVKDQPHWLTEGKEPYEQKPTTPAPALATPAPVVTDTPDGVKVEVPMSAKAEAKVTPKEQKKYFIDQIDAAIDSATDLVPTRKNRKDATLGSAAEDFRANAEEIGTVEIEVPGDGTFTLLNTKDALRKLKARAAAMFPARPPTASAPSKPSGKPSAIAKVGPRPGAAVKLAWVKLLDPFTVKDKNPTPKRATMGTPLFNPAHNETVATDSSRLVVALGVKIGTPIQEGGPQYSYVVPGYRQNQLPQKQNDQQTVRVADTEQFIRQIRQAKMATEKRKDGPDTIGLYAMPDGSVAVASMYSGDGYVSQDVSKGTMIGAYTADFVDEIVTFLRKTGNQAIEIRHRDEDSPLVLLGAKEYAVLMPVRGTELNAPDALAGMVPREAPAAKPQARKDAPPQPVPEAPAARAGELHDFGEKIGGARKDMVPSAAKEISDGDLAKMSFSMIWPKAEVDAIEDADMAALATALRNSIPAKPRKSYKVNRWVESVKTVRTLMQLANERGVANIMERMRTQEYRLLGGLADKVDLLRQLPRDQWDRIGKVENYPDAYRYEQAKAGEAGADKHTSLSGEEKWYKRVPSPHATAEVDGRIVRTDNLDALPTAVAERLGVPPEASAMQFEIRGRVGSSVRINKKGDPLYRPLKEFTGETAVEQARAFIENSRDDLVAAWEAIKESDNVKESDVRREANRPRTAKDYRQGRDVTPEMFSKAFGFRGVEFGNWVAQGANRKERQGMLNEAFDAFSDLADIMGVPSRALSLNGELAMAFGARGSGKFAAHYEPGKIVINLTKTRGAGSLAHEFFHALDHYFQRKRGETGVSRDRNFITYNPETYYQDKASGVRLPARRFNELLAKGRLNKASDWTRIEGVRPEVEEAFSALVKALDESPMHKRASLIDKGKSGGYWSRIIERAARSFENYVIHKMAQKGYQNDYLANVASIEEFQRDAGRYPYLLDSELAPVAEAFDNLFATIQTRETERGVEMFAGRQGLAPVTQESRMEDSYGSDEEPGMAPGGTGGGTAGTGLRNAGRDAVRVSGGNQREGLSGLERSGDARSDEDGREATRILEEAKRNEHNEPIARAEYDAAYAETPGFIAVRDELKAKSGTALVAIKGSTAPTIAGVHMGQKRIGVSSFVPQPFLAGVVNHEIGHEEHTRRNADMALLENLLVEESPEAQRFIAKMVQLWSKTHGEPEARAIVAGIWREEMAAAMLDQATEGGGLTAYKMNLFNAAGGRSTIAKNTARRIIETSGVGRAKDENRFALQPAESKMEDSYGNEREATGVGRVEAGESGRVGGGRQLPYQAGRDVAAGPSESIWGTGAGRVDAERIAAKARRRAWGRQVAIDDSPEIRETMSAIRARAEALGAHVVKARHDSMQTDGVALGNGDILIATRNTPTAMNEGADHELIHVLDDRGDKDIRGLRKKINRGSRAWKTLKNWLWTNYERGLRASGMPEQEVQAWLENHVTPEDVDKELVAELARPTTGPQGINLWEAFGALRKPAEQSYAKVKEKLYAGQPAALDAAPAAGQDGRMKATAENDRAYLAAVERGDMATAQRIVDEAAKKAGYTIGPVYHGTRTDFNIPRTRGMSAFDEKLANVRGDNDAGMFFSNVRDTARDFAQRGRRGDHRLTVGEINNDVWPEGARIVDAYLKLDNPKEFDGVGDFISYRSKNFNRIQDALREEGHDGIVLRDASYDASNPDETWYIATDPSQIKSADPVTYDDAGRIIPPSERFNPKSDDIRFAAAPPAPGTKAAERIRKQLDAGQYKAAQIASYAKKGGGDAWRITDENGRVLQSGFATENEARERMIYTMARLENAAADLAGQDRDGVDAVLDARKAVIETLNEDFASKADFTVKATESLLKFASAITRQRGFPRKDVNALSIVRKHVPAVVKAYLKGKGEARYAKATEAIDAAMYEAATAVREKKQHADAVASFTKMVRRINKFGIDQFAPENKDAIDGLVGDIAMKAMKDDAALRDAIDELRSDPEITAEESAELGNLLPKRPKDMTIDELRYITANLEWVLEDQKEKRAVAHKALRDEAHMLRNEFIEHAKRTKGVDFKEVQKELSAFDRPGQAEAAWATRAGTVAYFMDGKDDGPLYRLTQGNFLDAYRRGLEIKKISELKRIEMMGEEFDFRTLMDTKDTPTSLRARPRRYVLDSGETLIVSPDRMVAIHEMTLNPDNMRHATDAKRGGIVYKDSQSMTPIVMSESDMHRIAADVAADPVLSKAAAYIHFVNNEIHNKEGLNPISMRMDAHEIANEPNYFPIKTAAPHRKKQDIQSDEPSPASIGNTRHRSVESAGPLHKRLPSARGPIVLMGAFESLQESEQVVARYQYAPALRILKLAKEPAYDADGNYIGNLEGAVKTGWSKLYWKNVMDLADRIENPPPNETADNWVNWAHNRATVGQLTGNIAVYAYQPVSYVGALPYFEVQDWVAGGMKPAASWEKMGRYSPELYFRGRGKGSDLALAAVYKGRPHSEYAAAIKQINDMREAGEITLGDSLMLKASMVNEATWNLAQRGMTPITEMDRQAIGRIFNSAEIEAKRLNPSITDEEALMAAGRKTDHIIFMSQPTSAWEHRSMLQRLPGFGWRFMMRFSSQRTAYHTMLLRANYDRITGKINNTEYLKHMFSLLASQIAIAAVKTLVGRLLYRYEKGDEWKYFSAQVVASMMSLGGIGGDMIYQFYNAIFKRFGQPMSNPIVDGIVQTASGMARLPKAIADGDKKRIASSSRQLARGLGSTLLPGIHSFMEPAFSAYQHTLDETSDNPGPSPYPWDQPAYKLPWER